MFRSLVVRAVLPAVLFLFLPHASYAQYVYLDTNGDGVWSTADRMNANGTPTTVDAWINTNHNRDGSLATCNMADGDLGFWNSYAVNLAVRSGTATFSNFINRQANFDLTCVGIGVDFLSTSTEMTACRVTGISEAGGLKRMFTVTVTGNTGAPWLQYVALGGLSPNYTSFGTPCSGNDFDNTYKLDSDFFDNDGVRPAGTIDNYAPVVTAPATASQMENALIFFTLTAGDPDGDAIDALQGEPLPDGSSFTSSSSNTSGTFTWTPSFSQAGSYTIHWTAANSLSGTAQTAVTVNNFDRPPGVTAPFSASGASSTLITVMVSAADPDDDAITSLSEESTPPTTGSAFTTGAGNRSGTFSWTPTAAQAGRYTLWFTASNAVSVSASTSLNVTLAGDRPPAVTAPATVSGNENTQITFTVSASDPDGNLITSLTRTSPGTPGSTFTTGVGNTSGTFSWTPTFTQAGMYTVTFTASNALSGSAATTITVNNVDRSPVVTAPATATFTGAVAGTVTVTANDPDGQVITSLTEVSTPATTGSTFTAGAGNTSGTFSWTPTDAQAGMYTLTFTASNALSGTAATTVRVIDSSNFVGNPSFETSTEGWAGLDGATIQRVEGGYEGGYSLEVRGPAGSTGAFSVNDSPNWVGGAPAAGTIYRFEAWVRSTSATGNARLRIRQYVDRVHQGTVWSSSVPLGPAWQRITMDVTAVAAGATLDLQVMDTPVAPGEVFQTDNISIRMVDGSAPPAGNLVGNPSFESSTGGWAGHDGGTIQRVEGGHDGGYSLEVTGPAGSTGKFSVNDSPDWVGSAAAAGTIYQFSAWVRSAAVAGNAQLRVRQYVNKVNQGTWYSALVKLGPEWQRVTMNVPAVAAGATLDLQVMDAPIAAGEVFQTDDISIQILPSGSAAASFASFESAEPVEMGALMAPNPLNPEAVLSFTTREAGPIKVHIYSASGRHVRTLSESSTNPGRQAVRFNGMDASGRRLASGVYFFRIAAGSSRATGRFVVLK